MPQIISLKNIHTGDKCFHCRSKEYDHRVQIQSDIPEGIVNLCLCVSCVFLPAEELLEPILNPE